MYTFLLVVQTLIAAALVGAILMQRSEGGGLGVGGSSAGLMTARGKADFLSRSTAVLATLFVGMSIVLAAVAATRGDEGGLDTSLAGETAPVAGETAPAAPAEPAAPAPAEDGVPLAQ
ncbi:preprotein translocase subunit SecG [Sphingomicrobium astaxanthinifaciens]|uniref:preprotein translocase subunit SecG n=1 Tax=Sphingomicrobium astaxanthinifaciens TaxID=1227949 RepID=UPI001FCB6C9F|nr:preprotein translocase subunit SecG [Sphingomicrobium astaxanthinifaciens]MCJ7422180.1 preprotein translocase subunit SecG [Sphingomicrobium astaxanthinifaciens]